MKNVPGCTFRGYYQDIFHIPQGGCENHVESLKAHIELLDLYFSTYINF